MKNILPKTFLPGIIDNAQRIMNGWIMDIWSRLDKVCLGSSTVDIIEAAFHDCDE